ncbi:hypothetical protein MNB_SM-4-668 [hydrothermal vent metagenome]|uniref:DUF4842 domain-containing protein n=1 Tax=hydrothermal vent metagenome TaxID=652676 RepID=A0A1W1CF78_9ZZZZ
MKTFLRNIFLMITPMILLANPGATTTVNDSFTYTQTIDAGSPVPYYTDPGSSSGFGVYAYFDKDYGWQHDFPDYNLAGMSILSATLTITAWDVDSEAFWGTQGEYDGISLDGVDLNPGLLQGTNNTISITEFDLPIDGITDDGLLNMFLDIDMNHDYKYWATRLDKSVLTIRYKILVNNSAPFEPILSSSSPTPALIHDLNIAVVGPTPADADNDITTYTYRWYVDVGQGFYVDDEFAGKSNHSTSSVPSSETSVDEKWRVEVTPIDSKGVIGPVAVYSWPAITDDSDSDGVRDSEDDFPLDPLRAYISYYPFLDGFNTLLFEDNWPRKGDYDLNDLVVHFNYTFMSDTNNKLKEISLIVKFVANGGMEDRGFGIEIPGLIDTNIQSSSITYNGITTPVLAEGGHLDSAVFIISEDVSGYMPITDTFLFYNTEEGDDREIHSLVISIVLEESVDFDLSAAPFNPFIFPDNQRNKETHLVDHAPTDRADNSYLGTYSDASDPATGIYYRSPEGLPWALEISGEIQHLKERADFAQAYPGVIKWAIENGSKNIDWYVYPDAEYIWSGN